ncbi:MAG: DegT/DnrJ/EryC1/StrS family aminotransferase, partial [Candidatus Neomarinimicrobiota bacterium]
DANGAYLTEELRKIAGIKVPRPDYVTRHGYHLFVYTYESAGFKSLPLAKFLEAMRAEGISCGSGYSPLYRDGVFQNPIARLPLTRALDYYSKLHLPVVEELSTTTVWMYQSMMLGSRQDMEDIISAQVKKYQKTKRSEWFKNETNLQPAAPV